MARDDDTTLLDLINSRRKLQQGARDIHEVLVERLTEREEQAGVTARLLDAWERVRPFRENQLSGILDLEAGWADRTALAEEITFELAYEMGHAEAHLEGDDDLVGRARQVAEVVAQLLVEQDVRDEDALLGLLAAARACVLAGWSHADG